jgi:signal transduction histidine kinase
VTTRIALTGGANGRGPTPTVRLLAGLAVTLAALCVYSIYTIAQMRGLERLQTESIDRNRTDSLLLLRIQNNLNALGLGMRDMLDAGEPYPLTAWQAQFKRLRMDLDDAMSREEKFSPATRTVDQRHYLAASTAQFWDALDRIFALAQSGNEEEARTRIRMSLQARQAALSTAVSRLLVQNNENEERAAAETQRTYARVQHNVSFLLAAMLVVVGFTGIYLVQQNRRIFDQVAALSERRSELAQQLISMQENTLRYISRELHDEFGQILTAIGAMLQRAEKRNSAADVSMRADVREVNEIVQSTLEKVRTLSQALHPVVLEEEGLESALDTYLPMFEKRTGIGIHYEKTGESRAVDALVAIHLYRVLQEALNNVARHSRSTHANVRLCFSPDAVVLEVEDDGIGFKQTTAVRGMGLVSMRERAEMMKGRIEFLVAASGGALVRLTVPVSSGAAHA